MQAWHFTNGRITRDGHPVAPGHVCTISTDDTPVLHEYGYHASLRILDALQYAGGATLSRVEMGGTIVRQNFDLCATSRTVLWTVDAERILHEAACAFAWRALKRERRYGREPAKASWDAVRTKRRWVRGEATDDEMNAAWEDAWDAATDAGWYGAYDAARYGMRHAARDAAVDVVRDNAMYAAKLACDVANLNNVYYAAKAAEIEWMENYLVAMVERERVHELLRCLRVQDWRAAGAMDEGVDSRRSCAV